jgi:hypothetical protein
MTSLRDGQDEANDKRGATDNKDEGDDEGDDEDDKVEDEEQ